MLNAYEIHDTRDLASFLLDEDNDAEERAEIADLFDQLGIDADRLPAADDGQRREILVALPRRHALHRDRAAGERGLCDHAAVSALCAPRHLRHGAHG